MADKRIQDLTPASQVQTSDRFVLEQSGQAKSLTGQILINDLAAFLDGHGGIADISYTPPSGSSLTGTLTVTLADETVETFTVTNGRGITSITKTDTDNLVDTYEIAYNDGSTPTEFTVTNGKGIESIGYVESSGLVDYYEINYNDGSEPTTITVTNGEKGDTGDNWYVHIKWAAEMPTQDSDMLNYPSDYIGIYAGIGATAPTSYGAYEWYEYKGEKGDTGTGITSVVLESTSGLVDTYRVSFDDGSSTTFNVTNGSQINSITKTATTGLVDTYTVTLTNGLQTSFQVNNGKSIVSITWTNTTSPTGVPHVPGATDTYTIAYNDGDADTFQIYNGLDGEGASLTVDGIPSTNGDVPLLTIDTEHGAPTAQTVGSPKSRYFDAINSVLYICLGYDQTVGYIWRGAGVTVDAAMSTTSTNPVQNRVITNKIGTAALDTTAQNLSEAVNEILGDISGFADNLSDEYDSTATYAVGDLCIYDNTLYRCNTAISTPEAWNSIHWTETSVDDELDTISNNLNTLGGTVSGISSTIGNTALPTTAQTLTGAIAEIDGDVSSKVDKAGDTMTGDLEIDKSNPSASLKNTVADTSLSSDTATRTWTFGARDKNDNYAGYWQTTFQTDGRVDTTLASRRIVGGSNVTNYLSLRITNDGTRLVTLPDAAPWRSALELAATAVAVTRNTTNTETGSAVAFYDPGTKTVRITGMCGNSNGIALNAVMFNIASAYRPSSAKTGYGIFVYSGGTRASTVAVATNGNITQSFSGSTTSLFFTIEYAL